MVSIMQAAQRSFHEVRIRCAPRCSPRHLRSAVTYIQRCKERHVWQQRNSFHVHAALLPPAIFAGLFVTLWCWKCTMLVLFQNMIIYNPFLPPNARSLRISEYARQCGGISWREEIMRSLDGTQISLCVSDINALPAPQDGRVPVYILYMQGNASSLPPRLPDISWALRKAQESSENMSLTTICVSYRGYWKSHDRPSERGISLDTEAALRWTMKLHAERYSEAHAPKPVILLWGQSIGCGFATKLAATTQLPVHGLILETPFTSARDMLQALYPQRWLPYQYLWPFLRNHLDSWANLATMASRHPSDQVPHVYMIEAGKDELVPPHHAENLEKRCRETGIPVQRYKVRGALHNDASVRAEGKVAIAQSIILAVEAASHEGQADKESLSNVPSEG